MSAFPTNADLRDFDDDQLALEEIRILSIIGPEGDPRRCTEEAWRIGPRLDAIHVERVRREFFENLEI